MSKSIVAALEQRLRDEGLSETTASKLANLVVDDFQESSGIALPDFPMHDTLLDRLELGVRAIIAMRQCVAASFGNAARLPLPTGRQRFGATAVTDSRERRQSNSWRRVWGPYIDVGVLFQDDIKRLGDGKLIVDIAHPRSRGTECRRQTHR